MGDESRGYYGIQFHPEVTHTQAGKEILSRFVLGVAGCDASWKPDNIIDDAVERIRAQVGSDHVMLGLSGGVDSSVVAALLHRAIGDQLTCVFVDNGLLRLNEGDQVMQIFAENLGVKVIRVDAEQRFLGALEGLNDPEDKRKAIGSVFIDVFADEARKLANNTRFLAQGTIYPDVIESAGSRTVKRMSSNLTTTWWITGRLRFELVEPLRELFKDEVRVIGETLGLPHNMVWRHLSRTGFGRSHSGRSQKRVRRHFASGRRYLHSGVV